MDIRRELSKANEENDRCLMQLEDVLTNRPKIIAKEALDLHIHQSEHWRKEMGKRIKHLSQRMDEIEDRHAPIPAIKKEQSVETLAVEQSHHSCTEKQKELEQIKLRQKEFSDSFVEHQVMAERILAEKDKSSKELRKKLQSVQDSCLDRTMEAIRMANYSLESTHTVTQKLNEVNGQVKAIHEDISSLRQEFAGIRTALHETKKQVHKRVSFATRDELALVEKQCFQTIAKNQTAQRTKFEQFDRFREFIENRQEMWQNNVSQLAHEVYNSMEIDFSKHVAENTALRKLIVGLQQQVCDLKQAVATQTSDPMTLAEACPSRHSNRKVTKNQHYEKVNDCNRPLLFNQQQSAQKDCSNRSRTDNSTRTHNSLAPSQPKESDVSSTMTRINTNVHTVQDESCMSDEDEVLEVCTPSQLAGYDQGRKTPTQQETIVIEDDSESETGIASSSSSKHTRADTLMKAEENGVRVEVHKRTSLTWHHVGQGIKLYLSFGGAPSPTDEWRLRIPNLLLEDQSMLSTMQEIKTTFEVFQSVPQQLLHSVTQAATIDSSTASEDNKAIEHITEEDIRVKYGNVLLRVHRMWIKTIKPSIKKVTQSSLRPCTELDDLDISTPISLLVSQWTQHHSSKVDILEWRGKLATSFYQVLCSQFEGTFSDLSCNVASCSPAVFLFHLMLQPLEIKRVFPQHGRFRLTDFGRAVISTSWDRLLSSIPYEFFIENAWLEAQSDAAGQVISPLGISHVLATMIFYTSMIQLPETTSESASLMFLVERISVVTEWFYSMLVINGVKASTMASCEHLRLDKAIVEVEGVDSKFVSNLQLDGFFEVAHVVWLESNRSVESQPQEQ